MRYVKNRNRPAHVYGPLDDFCVHCRWSAQFVFNTRAKRCPAREQRRRALHQ